MALGDAALGSFPEQFGVGMFGEFVEANIAAVNGHGLGIGGESDDTGTVVELDDTDFDLLDDAGGTAMAVELVDGQGFLAVGKYCSAEIKDFGEFVTLANVFEGAGVIFGGEEIIAVFEPEPFADVFESIGVGPADTDGFFGEGKGLASLGVDGVLGEDPVELMDHEVFGEVGLGVDFNTRKDGSHSA